VPTPHTPPGRARAPPRDLAGGTPRLRWVPRTAPRWALPPRALGRARRGQVALLLTDPLGRRELLVILSLHRRGHELAPHVGRGRTTEDLLGDTAVELQWLTAESTQTDRGGQLWRVPDEPGRHRVTGGTGLARHRTPVGQRRAGPTAVLDDLGQSMGGVGGDIVADHLCTVG